MKRITRNAQKMTIKIKLNGIERIKKETKKKVAHKKIMVYGYITNAKFYCTTP